MDGLGLWLGEGQAIQPECSTSLKSTPSESKNLAIKAIRGAGGAIAFM